MGRILTAQPLDEVNAPRAASGAISVTVLRSRHIEALGAAAHDDSGTSVVAGMLPAQKLRGTTGH
jgi:hypothetical protein